MCVSTGRLCGQAQAHAPRLHVLPANPLRHLHDPRSQKPLRHPASHLFSLQSLPVHPLAQWHTRSPVHTPWPLHAALASSALHL